MATSGDDDDITGPMEEESSRADATLGSSSGDTEEDMYREAAAAVMRFKRPTTSYVQRVLRIGYNRAVSIIERMEREGIISGVDDAGKRQILCDDTGRDHAASEKKLLLDEGSVDAAQEDRPASLAPWVASSMDPEDKYWEAVAAVLQYNRATVPFIQRILRIGPRQAASMLERMERDGIVSRSETEVRRCALLVAGLDVEATEKRGQLIDLDRYRAEKSVEREKRE